jgi:hypothetical protein
VTVRGAQLERQIFSVAQWSLDTPQLCRSLTVHIEHLAAMMEPITVILLL